jgi:predicted ferric reductase
VRATGWLILYIALILAPVAVAWALDAGHGPGRWMRGAATALGFAALAVVAIQLALVSRVGTLSRAIGLDALLQFHREMAVVGLLLTIAHAVILAGGWRAFDPVTGPVAAGAAAFWLLLLIATTSFARRQLRLSYEAWQIVHLLCTVLIIGAALVHALRAGRYSSLMPMQALLFMYAALFLGLLLRYRLVRPLQRARAPWELVANEDAGGSTRLVTLRPVGHSGFSFDPGQFAWLTTGRSPLFSQKHPLSIASAPAIDRDGQVQFAIKALGDWSGTIVPALRTGHRAWIDGPYGAFTPPAGSSPVVLIAGGIGIAPMRSMLLSARARNDRRPFTLIYAAADPSRMAFARELEGLRDSLALTLVFVYERPPLEWTGEKGFITAAMIRRHAPADADYLVCGPLPMIDAFTAMRAELGIPRRRVHTERFQVV